MDYVIAQLKEYIQELKDERDQYKQDYQRLLKTAEEIAMENQTLKEPNRLMLDTEWHEDDGIVIWWKLPINEPPYVGTPLDSDFEEGYYTHFTRLVEPLDMDIQFY